MSIPWSKTSTICISMMEKCWILLVYSLRIYNGTVLHECGFYLRFLLRQKETVRFKSFTPKPQFLVLDFYSHKYILCIKSKPFGLLRSGLWILRDSLLNLKIEIRKELQIVIWSKLKLHNCTLLNSYILESVTHLSIRQTFIYDLFWKCNRSELDP